MMMFFSNTEDHTTLFIAWWSSEFPNTFMMHQSLQTIPSWDWNTVRLIFNRLIAQIVKSKLWPLITLKKNVVSFVHGGVMETFWYQNGVAGQKKFGNPWIKQIEYPTTFLMSPRSLLSSLMWLCFKMQTSNYQKSVIKIWKYCENVDRLTFPSVSTQH